MIAPPAVTLNVPPLAKLSAGKAIAALLNVNVKLAKLVRDVRLVGNTAPASVSRTETVEILPNVPAKVIPRVPKSLACPLRLTLELEAVTEIDTGFVPPVAVIIPPSAMPPVPAIKIKLRPIVDVPNTIAPLVVKLTSFAPLFDKVTGAMSEFAPVKVIALLPALKLAELVSVNAPVWVIAPPAVTVNVPFVDDIFNAGKLIAALLNVNVTLRKLVREVRLVGNAALAFVLFKMTSRKLLKTPAKVIAVEPKLLA